jgi:hypothetical protein
MSNLYKQPTSGSKPPAKNPQIDGKALKLFQPSKYGNIICGTGNDSWYGKIEIDYESKWVIRSQAA